MWALIALGLLGVAAAVPTSPVVTYNFQMQSARNSVMSHQLTSKIEDQLKKKCERYGDSDSYENVINVRNSIIREIHAEAMEKIMPYAEAGEKPDIIKVFCEMSPTLKRSANRIVRALKPCTNPGSRDELGYFSNITESLLDYVCYNNGQRVKTFINDGGLECINEKQSDLLQCAESAVSGEESNSNSDNNIFGSNESLDKDEMDKKLADDCRQVSTLETCIKGELDQCPNPSTSSFVVGLLDSVFNPVCQRFNN